MLAEDNVFQTVCVAGKRKVSTALLGPRSSNSSSVSSSSSTSASVRTVSFTSASFDIPIAPRSIAALEFIGFNNPTATAIYNRWESRPNPNINPDDLINYAYTNIGILRMPYYQNYRPRQAMTMLGLTQNLQDALMDLQFTKIFWTEGLHFWVIDKLQINYATVLQLQKRLKNHAIRSRANKKLKRGSVQGVFQAPAHPPAQPQTQAPEVTATINLTPEDHWLPTAHIALETKDSILPNHVVLFRGKAAGKMNGNFRITEDGSVNMSVLKTKKGGDFNHRTAAHYRTPEKDVAEVYKGWAERRCFYTETWLIRIQISVAFINSLTSRDLSYSLN